MDHKRVFITGGASGLGQALAARYARAGYRVCVGDLDEARCASTLDQVRAAGGDGHALRCDVTREEDLQAAADWLQERWGGVDLVFNNAGVAQVGALADVPLQDWQWIIDINLLGVVRGCKVFAPRLRAQGRGHLVNISSLAGLIHPAGSAAYSATKAAVVALSEVLKAELEPDGVRVSVVCPAFFRTQLAESMRAADPQSMQRARKLVGKARFGAEEIADKIFHGVARGDFHILTHRQGQVAWLLKRLLPYPAFSVVMRRLSRGGFMGRRR